MGSLLLVDGPRCGQRYRLDRDRSVLGRHPDCDVVIEAEAVSRRHAQILLVEDQYYLEDLDSRNGTFLNSRELTSRATLSDGDEICVCDVSFEFRASPAPQNRSGESCTDSPSISAERVDDEPRSANATIVSRLDVSAQADPVNADVGAGVKLLALLEITRNLGKALLLDGVLPEVLDSLFKIFAQADRGFIVLREPDGMLAPRWTKLRRAGSDEGLHISRTIVNRVLEAKEAILSSDAATDARFEMSRSVLGSHIRSMMCVPLIDSDGDAFGVLQIDTLDRTNRFRHEDLDVLASVATQAAIAIDNARLHEEALRQRALQRELELANEVQRGFLPENPPSIDGYEFFNFYRAADHVGGDYFDYIPLPEERVAVVVADVVGHGVVAALLMAKLSAETRSSLALETRPGKVLARLNEMCGGEHSNCRFVTMVLAVLDPKSGEVAIANAGHPRPLLRRADGEVQELTARVGGIPLGILADVEYGESTAQLAHGETLTMFTDGISEARDASECDAAIRQAIVGSTQSGADLGPPGLGVEPFVERRF